MKLLLVEDDAALAGALAGLLESKGFAVVRAADGVEGLELARREKPDLVLLDAMLPRLSGFDVCRALRLDGDLKRTPVLMLTALGGEADIDRAFASGVDAYMTKPFDGDRLLGKLAELLKGPGRGRAS